MFYNWKSGLLWQTQTFHLLVYFRSIAHWQFQRRYVICKSDDAQKVQRVQDSSALNYLAQVCVIVAGV